MICDGCQKDLERTIVGKCGHSVNCLAYGCSNRKQSSRGDWYSDCEKDFLLMHIYKYCIPKPKGVKFSDNVWCGKECDQPVVTTEYDTSQSIRFALDGEGEAVDLIYIPPVERMEKMIINDEWIANLKDVVDDDENFMGS